jgi:hypothetical protein
MSFKKFKDTYHETIYFAEYSAISPAIKGRDITNKPPIASGIFSESLILSKFELKYSSGSFSLVSFLGFSPSPMPKPIFRVFLVLVDLAIELGAKADVERTIHAMRMVTNEERLMVAVGE